MAVKEKIPKNNKVQKKAKRVSIKEKAKPEEKKIRIKLVRSLIGHPRYQREVVRGLGLRKINSVSIRKDTPEIWGMVKKISHLVKVEVIKKNEPQ
ncbi:MAG: 50S ribosomal protein L30 [Candidatus Aminicenantaceae bacterium]